MSHNLPYLTSQKRLKSLFEKIKDASTPDKFDVKYVNEKLLMKGGTASSIPPYLKRIGFISSDGTPTEWYKEFRNPALSGPVAFKALKHAYSDIYEISENAHRKSDADLKGIVAQVTGLDHDNSIITYIVATFKTLKSFATFEEPVTVTVVDSEQQQNIQNENNDNNTNIPPVSNGNVGLNIGYNINLNLPATSDIAVFDAIFKSLKEHLLKE